MASAGNPNQQPANFDMQQFFKPSTNPSSPNPSNPNNLSQFPASSYPPPSGPFSYPPQSTPFHHPHFLPSFTQEQLSGVHHQRPVSYTTAPLPPPPHISSPNPNPNPNHGARLMALLGTTAPSNMEAPTPAMASTSMVSPVAISSEFPLLNNPQILHSLPSAPPVNMVLSQPAAVRLPSSKPPKGRHLVGDHVVYDVAVRLQGEVQPQLEVTPITKYVSDPGLVVGRQIAVNRTYICYGLKLGAIRVLNINTALRSLLRGHNQRVTDMAFFAEEVHLLASASIDGRVFVWKINEGPDEEDKPQITGKVVVAIQIIGEGDSVHPRICWHSHKQEILIVGIGKLVLKIDTTKVVKGEGFSAEEPLRCPIDRLIEGVQIVGKHEGEVTELSMCQWMTSRLASASTDGTVRIWEDRKALPLAVLRPYDGRPVNSVTFITAPSRPDHINLITAGPLNREVKIWASASEEGWLLPSDAESWQCTQTLELRSSEEPRNEEAFFNQVVALPRAGLILLANAKKNAIYAIHIEYGPNPLSTRFNYIAEFTVTMPILSLTGTSESMSEEHVVQIYCVQTQAIQQYALNLSQCLPPPLENTGLEKTESSGFRAVDATSLDGLASSEPSNLGSTEMAVGNAAFRPTVLLSNSESAPAGRYTLVSDSDEVRGLHESATSGIESKPNAFPPPSSDADSIHLASPTLPLSPRLSRKLSGLRTPSNSFDPGSQLGDRGSDQPVLDYSVDRRVDNVLTDLPDISSLDGSSRKEESKVTSVIFKHPTHLVTPSEILSMSVTSSENSQVNQTIKRNEAKVQDVVVNNDTERIDVEVKVVGEAGSSQNDEFDPQKEPHIFIAEKRKKSFCSQASDLSMQMARGCSGTFGVDDTRQVDDSCATEVLEQPQNVVEEVQDSSKDEHGTVSECTATTTVPHSPAPAVKGKKQKSKNSQVSGPASPSPSPFNSTDSSNEPGVSPAVASTEAAFAQIAAMQETLNQLMTMQREMQKQLSVMVAVPVTKEGKRLEAALGKSMEKVVKANNDALWVRLQEENAKHEKIERDRTQQMTTIIANYMSKDLPAMLEKILKKEMASVGPSVARAITPVVEKTLSSVVAETFQRGVGDKAVSQLEKSVNLKLEATVARQIQAQFQTSGKQALQDALRSSFEASVIPAFEMSCKTMFEQVDAAFQRGMIEHAAAVQQQFESAHSSLAVALRDAINSASSVTQTLTGEIADGQRKLLAFAAAGANSNTGNPLATQISNGPLGGHHEMVEAPLDPTKEISRLISERKFEEAFTAALQRSDVSIVSWLCSQVDLKGILSMLPQPLSQRVLLSLLQQLAYDISKETSRKLAWMTYVAVAINPADSMVAIHVRPILEQVYQILAHNASLPTVIPNDVTNMHIVMHIINSMLMSCK